MKNIYFFTQPLVRSYTAPIAIAHNSLNFTFWLITDSPYRIIMHYYIMISILILLEDCKYLPVIQWTKLAYDNININYPAMQIVEPIKTIIINTQETQL